MARPSGLPVWGRAGVFLRLPADWERQMLFMGKFTFQSTNPDGPLKYLTSVTNSGLISPIVDATMVTEKERCLLYQPSEGADGELIIQMGGLAYLSALDTEALGFVNAQPSLQNSYRFKLAGLGQVGAPVSMQIFLRAQKRWAPVRYTVNNLLPYLTFPLSQDAARDDPPGLLTTFTQTQITPSLATLQSSKCAQRCDLRQVDLSGADLSGIDFTGADFTGTTLNGAKFKGAILTNATLTGASLAGTDLSGATLDGAIMTGLDLTKVVWGNGTRLSAKGTHFEGCFASGCQLGSESPPYADFTKAHFDGADFTGACLDNACLQDAFMIGGVFVGASMAGADLNGAHLGGISQLAAADMAYAYMPNVTFTGANLFGVSFAFASLFGGATSLADVTTLEQADFSNAYLEGISFKDAPLQGSKFNNACLVSVDFTGADLSSTLAGSVRTSLAGACLNGAIFTDAKLADADFTGATVAFERGHIKVRYCTPQGSFPPSPDFEQLNYQKTTGLDLESMRPTTICPNGSTVQANQERGHTLKQMLTIANPATSWVPIGCFSASPEKVRELVDATRVAPPAKDRICETTQAVVRVPDFTALRDICRLGRDLDARRFFFHLEALPASRVAGLIRYYRKQQEQIGLSCWPAYRKTDGAFVGLFELRPSELAGGTGFTVAVMPAFRGNPLVKEICRAVLGYGFSRGGFDRIVALVEPDNLVAQGFVTKLGFRRLHDVSAPNEVTLHLYEVRRNSLKRS
jgi:uncharacterized protein YjbI with pentapeptide repeats/RimJ/RimL family protein N-acetyltransferase